MCGDHIESNCSTFLFISRQNSLSLVYCINTDPKQFNPTERNPGIQPITFLFMFLLYKQHLAPCTVSIYEVLKKEKELNLEVLECFLAKFKELEYLEIQKRTKKLILQKKKQLTSKCPKICLKF